MAPPRRLDVQILSRGVVYWENRKADDPTRVWVECRCGSGRYISHKAPGDKKFTGICRRCARNAKNRRITRGYVHIYIGSLPEEDQMLARPMLKNGSNYILEHRLIAARQLGRPLRPDEWVHHLNGIKDDNQPENLEVASASSHSFQHLTQLHAEIRRLRALLDEHGISYL